MRRGRGPKQGRNCKWKDRKDLRGRGREQFDERKVPRATYAGTDFVTQQEASFARYFDSVGLAWEYETQSIPYINGDTKAHTYIPDFYLPGLDLHVECKQRVRKVDMIKMLNVVRQHPDMSIEVVFTLKELRRLISVRMKIADLRG